MCIIQAFHFTKAPKTQNNNAFFNASFQVTKLEIRTRDNILVIKVQ